MKNNLSFFSSYVSRTPVLPISFYTSLLQNYSINNLRKIVKDQYIQEALYLASPVVYNQLLKWLENPNSLSKEKERKLEQTLLKYLARMSSRCTPFGMFSGCSVGSFSEKTSVILQDKEKYKRVTQLDMFVWVALLQKVASNTNYKKELTYFANNSLYKLGNFYRYIQYSIENNKRSHIISAIKQSEYLEKIFNSISNGLSYCNIVNLICDNETDRKDAEDFIDQLILEQILVSELDATITGNQWESLMSCLSKKQLINKELSFFQNLKDILNQLDNSFVNKNSDLYNEIKTQLTTKKIDYEDKYVFQTDVFITTKQNTVATNVLQKVEQTLLFLTRLRRPTQKTKIEEFIVAYQKRYENKKMPLTTVLDTETGVGYPINHGLEDTHSFLEKFFFPNKKQYSKNEIWTEIDFVLEKKLQECLDNNSFILSLSEKDFPSVNSDLEDIPSTFSTMIELVEDDEKEFVYLESAGNKSAAKLLGRFGYLDTQIESILNEITNKEAEKYNDIILAEIIHLPESRTGNILRRPILRTYEIPFLVKSVLDIENQILLSDLELTIKNNKVLLFSKRLQKQVIPCLSNAHNYSGTNSLPIYHFLCDLQAESSNFSLGFSWGILLNHYNKFPRVIYKQTIISKAKWILRKRMISTFVEKGINEFKKWGKENYLPRYFNWASGDNTLLIDFKSDISLSILLDSIKNHYEEVILEEFLFPSKKIKNHNEDVFANQFIISFYNE